MGMRDLDWYVDNLSNLMNWEALNQMIDLTTVYDRMLMMDQEEVQVEIELPDYYKEIGILGVFIGINRDKSLTPPVLLCSTKAVYWLNDWKWRKFVGLEEPVARITEVDKGTNLNYSDLEVLLNNNIWVCDGVDFNVSGDVWNIKLFNWNDYRKVLNVLSHITNEVKKLNIHNSYHRLTSSYNVDFIRELIGCGTYDITFIANGTYVCYDSDELKRTKLKYARLRDTCGQNLRISVKIYCHYLDEKARRYLDEDWFRLIHELEGY